MRASYWSNSKFAARTRKIFSLPEQPECLSADGWNAFHKLENSISPFGVKFIDSFDTVQNIVHWPMDTIESIAYYFSNLLNRTHVLRTSTKPGRWADLANRIPDALMYSIIDYVEVECFWMNVAFMSTRPENMSKAVWNYKNQGYLKRRLWPSKITDEERAYHGLQYMKFQMDQCEDEAVTNYQKLVDAYHFAKNRYFGFDAFVEAKYYDIPTEEDFMNISDAQRECFKVIRDLEKEFNDEVTKHCFAIVEFRDYLWT